MSEDNQPKIGALRISKMIGGFKNKNEAMTGTYHHYIAPEILQDEIYSKKSDIWSLGIILFELCSQQFPFPQQNPSSFKDTIEEKNSTTSSKYSRELKELLAWMLKMNPNERPDIQQILNSKLITNHVLKMTGYREYRDKVLEQASNLILRHGAIREADLLFESI